MTPLIFLLLALWMLVGLLLLLFRSGGSTTGALTHLTLGALIALDIWGPAGVAGQALVVPAGALELVVSPRILAPVVYLAVMSVYLRDGVTATSSLLFSLLVTLGLVGVGLPLLANAGAWLRSAFGLSQALLLSIDGLQEPLAEAFGLAIGAYLSVLLLQAMRNRLGSRLHSGTLVLALLTAGWAQGTLTATAAFVEQSSWALTVRAELLGWAIAALALWPAAYLLVRWLGPGDLPAGVGLPIRPVSEVLQRTLDLRQALQRSETRAEALHQRLRLLTAVRHRIVRADDERSLLREVADEVNRSPLFAGCWIGMLNRDQSRIVTVEVSGLPHIDLPAPEADPRINQMADDRAPESILAMVRSQPELAALGTDGPKSAELDVAAIQTESGALGALAVGALAGSNLSNADRRLIQGLAQDLGHGLSRLRLQAQRGRQVRELESIRSLTTRLISEHGVAEVYEEIVEGAMELFDAQGSELYVVEPDRTRVRSVLERGEPHHEKGQVELISQEGILRAAEQRTVVKASRAAREAEAGVSVSELAIPLGGQSGATEVLRLIRVGGVPFSSGDMNLVDVFVNQVAIAVENARLIETERRRSRELETLRKANLSLTSSLELQAVLEAILEQALEIVSAFDAHIFLYDGKELSFGAALWSDRRHREPFAEPREDGLTYRVARSGERIVVEDMGEDPLYLGADNDWEGAIVGLPLAVGGTVLGVMNVAFDRPREIGDDDLHILELLADQAAVALENARLYESTSAERKRLQLLYDVTRALGSSLDPDEIMQRAADLTTENLGGLMGGVNVIEEDDDRIRLVGVSGMPSDKIDEINRQVKMRVGKGFVGWVAARGEPAISEDVRSDDRWLPVPGFDDQVRSAMAAPIRVDDQIVGVMAIFHRRREAFDDEHLELLTAIAQQVGLAWANARRYRQVERRLVERSLLQQVAQVINSRLEMEQLLDVIVQQVHTVLDYPVVDIVLVEGEELVLHASQGLDRPDDLRFPIEQGVTGRVVRTGQPAFVPDVEADSDYLGLVSHVACEIAVPLRKGDVVIGALNVEAFEPGALTQEDLRVLILLGDQISVAIENAALYDRLRQHTQELETVVQERTAALEEALAKAREADRLKTQFVSDVSHELRTPLSNIRLYVELLSSGSEARAEEYLETLGRETDRLVALIEDLLSISRLDADSVPMRFEALDVERFSRSLVKDRERLFSERGLELTWAPASESPKVWADEQLLAQVLANLMTNAMHYTPTGGQVTVGYEPPQDPGWVQLYVADSGLGIPDSERDQLFRRFFRGSASRQTGNPGTGLGLAICNEIIERHGGWIEVQSEVGQGSTFTLWLPEAESEMAVEKAASRAGRLAELE